MFVNTLGSGNIAIGPSAAYPTSLSNTLTGNSNTIIGSESARNIQGSAAGNLVLGNSVNLPTANGSNQVVIKNLIFGTGASGTGTTIQTTAKAGINVNNPQSTLDVEGNMAIGATYSGTTAAPTNGLIVEGNTGIGTSSPQRRLHITGTVRVDTLTRDVPTRIVGADADGDLAAFKLGTGLSIASDTLKTSAILPADTSVFARDWQIAGTTNYLPKFTGASSVGNSVMYESSSKIGIGTTSPAHTLDISGETGITTNKINFASTNGGTGNPGSYISGEKLGNWGGRIDFYARDAAGALTKNIMSIEGSGGAGGGYVGIKTTTPARSLHINSTDALKLPAGTTAERPSVGITGDLRMNTSPDADSLEYYNSTRWVTVQDKLQNPVTGTGTTNYLPKFTGASSVGNSVMYESSSKIGIGTTSPAHTLDISGETGITTNKINFASTNGGTGNPGSYISGEKLGNWGGRIDFYARDAAGALTKNIMSIEGSGGAGGGYVGIKTTTPARSLHINSTDALKLPAGTTAERPSVGITGDLRMNTSPAADSLEYYNGASWVTVQDKLQNPVTGTGTANYLPKFTGASSVGNSPLYNVSDNKILIGATSTVSQFYNSLGVHSASNDNDSYKIPTLEVNAYNQYYPPNLIFRRSRASTVGGLTTVNSGDVLGTIGFYGADGAAFNPGALISALVDATSGIYDTPTALLFSTTGDGSYTATEKMRITNAGHVGIGTTSPDRTLHVEGEARISDLTTDTLTRIVGADADGDLGAITLGTGLSISSGTLNASGITSVYIPINLFSPGDTVTNTTNAKNFFLVHSGLNGYCIDSYTVKAIAGTGTADIQVDKNDTGGNLQAVSGTTVYTKDTNIALVTGDYIRGQVFNISGTLIGLGLTLEIKATCN
jgi:hypothetical protein